MKTTIVCDLIESIKTNYDKKVELTMNNPMIDEYEDMKISNIIDMVGLTEVSEIIKHKMNDYIAEIDDSELLKLSLKIAKEMSDRNINIKETI